MTKATLPRPTEQRTATLGARTRAVGDHVLGTAPLEVLRGGADTNRSVRKASTTAGVGLLVMSVLSVFGYLVAVKGLVVPGNAARTAKNIAGHEGLVRFGILCLYLVAALDVVVASGFGYVFDTVVRVLVRGSSSDISAITGMGEFVFALWLLIRGRHITMSDSTTP